MLKLYVTRHGRTVWNSEGRMQGWQNSPLDETGKKDAAALGKRLADVNFDAVYASPSGRTLETARLVTDNKITTDERIKEAGLGDWEGGLVEELRAKHGDKFKAFWEAPHLYDPAPHKGEHFAEVRSRVSEFLEDLKSRHQGGTVLAVSHAVTIKSLLAELKNLPPEALWTPPHIHGTSLTLIEFADDGHTIKLEGDISHIERDLKP